MANSLRRRLAAALGIGGAALAGCGLMGGPAVPTTTFTDPDVVALVNAASRGDLAEVDRLRAGGVDIDVRGRFGMTPLIWVAAAGNDTGVVTLLAAGADRSLGTDRGDTALHMAAERPSTSTLRTLLAEGVDPSTRNTVTGASAIWNALMNERPENITFLIQHGTDVGIVDRMGDTALHQAAKINQADAVLELLAAGADPTVVNKQRVTFQRYLTMTPAKVRSAEFQRDIDRVQAELRRRGIPVEN